VNCSCPIRPIRPIGPIPRATTAAQAPQPLTPSPDHRTPKEELAPTELASVERRFVYYSQASSLPAAKRRKNVAGGVSRRDARPPSPKAPKVAEEGKGRPCEQHRRPPRPGRVWPMRLCAGGACCESLPASRLIRRGRRGGPGAPCGGRLCGALCTAPPIDWADGATCRQVRPARATCRPPPERPCGSNRYGMSMIPASGAREANARHSDACSHRSHQPRSGGRASPAA